MTTITESEWLSELEKLSKRSDSGLTSPEWSEKLGRSVHYVQKMLMDAKKRGWLVVGRQTREALDGRTYNAVVYRVVRPKGGK